MNIRVDFQICNGVPLNEVGGTSEIFLENFKGNMKALSYEIWKLPEYNPQLSFLSIVINTVWKCTSNQTHWQEFYLKGW